MLNSLLCSHRIDGYALVDPSNGNVVLAFGVLYEGFMIPDKDGRVSGVEERLALCESLQLVDIPGTLSVKGKRMIVVRREASLVFAVGHRRQYSVSIHSLYAGVLIVAYSNVHALGEVLQGLTEVKSDKNGQISPKHNVRTRG